MKRMILMCVVMCGACAAEPRTDEMQSNLCTAADQQDGLCAPFTLAGAKRASRDFANQQYPTNLSVSVECEFTPGPGGFFGCSISVEVAGNWHTAGCTIYNVGDDNVECWAD